MRRYYGLVSACSIRSLRSNFLEYGRLDGFGLVGAFVRVARPMKLALKYGIAVTLIIAAWVALKHFVLHLEGPQAQFADVAIFNLSAIVALGLGIKERRVANGDRLTFLQGLGTG